MAMSSAYRYSRPPARFNVSAPIVMGAAGALLALFALVWSDLVDLTPQMLGGAGIAILFIGLWALRLVPDPIAAIIFFLGAVAVADFPAEVVFSGFYSTAAWLAFGGLVISVAAEETGIAARLARIVSGRARPSFPAIIWGITGVAAALTFLVPAPMIRALMMLPIVLALADAYGFEPGSRGRTGMLLTAALAGFLPGAAVLPSSLSGMALVGASENLYGVSFSYGQYLAANFPVLGLGTFVLIPLLVSRRFADVPAMDVNAVSRDRPAGTGNATLLILLATVFVWAADTGHGIAPGWIALAAALACLTISGTTMNGRSVWARIDLGAWLLFAAVISLGATINHTGLGKAAGEAIVDLVAMTPGDGPMNFALLVGVGLVTACFTTVIAAPVVFTSLAQSFATATGWPLETVLLTQTPTWIFFAFPFQAPMLVAVLAAGHVSIREAARLMAIIAAIGLAVLVPLQYLWLQFLGYLP